MKLLIVTIASDAYIEIFSFWLAHHSKLEGAEVHVILLEASDECRTVIASCEMSVFIHDWKGAFDMDIYPRAVVDRVLRVYPHDYHLTLDVDEFWESDVQTNKAIALLNNDSANYVRCRFVDRFAPNGNIISLSGVVSLFDAFPIKTAFTREVVKGCEWKCAFARHGIYGGHHIEYLTELEDRPAKVSMPIHHFRYYVEARRANALKVSLHLWWGGEYAVMDEVLLNGIRNIAELQITDLEEMSWGGYETDRGSEHTYLRVYYWKWRHLCGTPCRLLELGIHQGGGLELWRDWLGPSAEIVGIDTSSVAEPNGVRVIRSNPYALKTIESLPDRSFDIIIDNGSHDWPDVATVLVGYRGKVKVGGYLCIESESCESRHFHLIKAAFPDAEFYDFSHLKGSADKLIMLRC